jgi:hypothetical protein
MSLLSHCVHDQLRDKGPSINRLWLKGNMSLIISSGSLSTTWTQSLEVLQSIFDDLLQYFVKLFTNMQRLHAFSFLADPDHTTLLAECFGSTVYLAAL